MPNPDILKELGREKPPKLTLVGFALETDDEIQHARAKLREKNADIIVLNSLRERDAGFGGDYNAVTVLDRTGNERRFDAAPKTEIAKHIWDCIEDYRKTTWV